MNVPESGKKILSLRSDVLRKEVNQAEDLKFPRSFERSDQCGFVKNKSVLPMCCLHSMEPSKQERTGNTNNLRQKTKKKSDESGTENKPIYSSSLAQSSR